MRIGSLEGRYRTWRVDHVSKGGHWVSEMSRVTSSGQPKPTCGTERASGREDGISLQSSDSQPRSTTSEQTSGLTSLSLDDKHDGFLW